jgi:hypothetical protein
MARPLFGIASAALLLILASSVNAFVPKAAVSVRISKSSSTTSKLNFQPWKDLTEMLQQWDDVIDDFMAKRMGNGEVFYGQRKFKPSNRPNTEGRYNGMGMSDKTKIDIVRDNKEERLLALEQRRQQKQQKQQQQQQQQQQNAKNKK